MEGWVVRFVLFGSFFCSFATTFFRRISVRVENNMCSEFLWRWENTGHFEWIVQAHWQTIHCHVPKTSFDKFGQVWTSLDKFRQVWTSLDQFMQHRSLLLARRNILRPRYWLLGIVGIRTPNRSCCSRLQWIPFRPYLRQYTNARKLSFGTWQ